MGRAPDLSSNTRQPQNTATANTAQSQTGAIITKHSHNPNHRNGHCRNHSHGHGHTAIQPHSQTAIQPQKQTKPKP